MKSTAQLDSTLGSSGVAPSPGKILLVDDDPEDARLALAALGEVVLADQVVLLTDGQRALDYIYGRESYAGCSPPMPAVILLDIKLPRVDGFEVLRTIKSDPERKSQPIVVLTSSRRDQDLVEAYRLGANGYVVKIIDFDAYRAALEWTAKFWAFVNEPPPSRPPESAPGSGPPRS